MTNNFTAGATFLRKNIVLKKEQNHAFLMHNMPLKTIFNRMIVQEP
jgi:hypothetical protein